MISRQPLLILPLACRIPGVQVKGPNASIEMPTEKETFGEFRVWIEFYLPGTGPLAQFTRNPTFRSNVNSPQRVRRAVDSETGSNSSNSTCVSEESGSRIKQLDLYVRSNCSVVRAEMIVNDCIESETEDFAISRPILKQGSVTFSLCPVIFSKLPLWRGQMLLENLLKEMLFSVHEAYHTNWNSSRISLFQVLGIQQHLRDYYYPK